VTAGSAANAAQQPALATSARLRRSLLRFAAVIVPLAAVEWIAYPLLLHDSSTWWASYVAYLAVGVIVPGTLVAQAFVHWRTDWLTWIGIGWALGHVLEVVFVQVAKTTGMPRLFVLWIPLAYLLVWRKRRWQGEVMELVHPLRCAMLVAIVIAFASTTFVAFNLVELSPQPSYQSDIWFHINEAHEFRDHLDTADPRIAGQPYAYHTLEYGPAVGANLAVDVPLANLIARYSGLSMVWLLVLLLFNSGRNIRGPAAAFLAAALIVAPLDVFSLISNKLSFGSSIIFSSVDLSTSTLVGFWALAALFLPLRWFFAGGRVRDLWVLALLAYMAAGSKSVPGPLLLAAAGAAIIGTLLQRRRPTRRAMVLVGLFALIVCVTALPILLRATVADSASLTFASAARNAPYASQLTRIPARLRLGFYPIGLAFLLWFGAAFGAWRLTRKGEWELMWFVAGALGFGALVVEATSIPGESELFFLFMAMVLIAPVAALGLCQLGALMWRGRHRITPITIAVIAFAAVGIHLKVGGAPSPPLYDGSRYAQGVFAHITVGVGSYKNTEPPSEPVMSWIDGDQRLLVTPPLTSGLSWLRSAADASTVIATNVPGAALYAGACECREYFQTEQYASQYIAAQLTPGATVTAYDARKRLLEAWIYGEPGSVAALRKAGVTVLIVDHVNGFPVSPDDLPRPAFSNAAISIYRI
jgi:hypothetical protein